MFGTLRYNSTNDSTEFMDRGYGFLLDDQHAQPGQHAACDQCRSKKLRCSGQKRGCDRCKAASTTCIYSITRDDGRAKRRRRTDNPNTVKHQNEDRTCQTSTPHDPKSTSVFSSDAAGGEPKSTDNDVLLGLCQQELPSSMDSFPGTDAPVTNTTVPPQQDGLLQELENDFDLLDSSAFDVSPEYNLQPAKSFGEFSGSVPGPELDHNLSFIPKPIYGGISILSDPRVLTAPSRQTSDDHLASTMSGDGNDDVMIGVRLQGLHVKVRVRDAAGARVRKTRLLLRDGDRFVPETPNSLTFEGQLTEPGSTSFDDWKLHGRQG
ncbi:MAG: hypothetical protein Q9203_005144 [Teloschistes exilis]